ncbi:hypothetical protein HX882_03110 [Pseudomonas gingeri]|uniref:Uncharacterized protein n=1 Tax=Pseudomonas gingeri TaxID=117681 RepID=A0A7Y8C157_9PSED|nr:hypothetical protein [Pseudomonas gingeri]NWB94877.1 hypothetical protein [Pseudomonas gingeri]
MRLTLKEAASAPEKIQLYRIFHFRLNKDQKTANLDIPITTLEETKMIFSQQGPTLDYRKNLILHALLKIELLCELAKPVSPELCAKTKEQLVNQVKLCELVSSMALHCLNQELLVPAFLIESVMDEVKEYPFTYEEIEVVLNSQLRDVLLFQP